MEREMERGGERVREKGVDFKGSVQIVEIMNVFWREEKGEFSMWSMKRKEKERE